MSLWHYAISIYLIKIKQNHPYLIQLSLSGLEIVFLTTTTIYLESSDVRVFWRNSFSERIYPITHQFFQAHKTCGIYCIFMPMIQAHLLLPPSRWKTLGKTESLPKSKQRTFSPPPSPPFHTPRSHYYTVAHLLDTVKNPKRSYETVIL